MTEPHSFIPVMAIAALLSASGCSDEVAVTAPSVMQGEEVAVDPEPVSELHAEGVARIARVLSETPYGESNNVIHGAVVPVEIRWTLRKWAGADALHGVEVRAPRNIDAGDVPELIRPAWTATDPGIVGDDGDLAVALAAAALQHGSAYCDCWHGISWGCQRMDFPVDGYSPSEQWRLEFDLQPVAEDYQGPEQCAVRPGSGRPQADLDLLFSATWKASDEATVAYVGNADLDLGVLRDFSWLHCIQLEETVFFKDTGLQFQMARGDAFVELHPGAEEFSERIKVLGENRFAYSNDGAAPWIVFVKQ